MPRLKAKYKVGDYVWGDAGYAIIIWREYKGKSAHEDGGWYYGIEYLEPSEVSEDELE